MRALALASLVAGLACGRTPPIPHVVVIVQENHTFDNYFGNWCTAAPGSNPSCGSGPSCCEAAPAKDPAGSAPVVLDDTEESKFDPDHSQACELFEIDHGAMDRYTACADGGCCSPTHFAIASGAPDGSIAPYLAYAAQYAINDHYFQSVAGQSSSNDMYLATAKFVFLDNTEIPDTKGYTCTSSVNLDPDAGIPGWATPTSHPGMANLGSLLLTNGHTFAFYAEGYDVIVDAGVLCPGPPMDCPASVNIYPCLYSPSDDPFAFFPDVVSNPANPLRDFGRLQADLAGGTLPDVSFVKALGYKSEHPGYGQTLTAGVTFVTGVVDAIAASAYAKDTLVLITWDESGGFFDHVAPPATSTVDDQPYGPRLPVLAIGPLARPATVDHTPLEHASIVKFIEWDFLGSTGQLKARDATANNIGGLLETSLAVPTN